MTVFVISVVKVGTNMEGKKERKRRLCSNCIHCKSKPVGLISTTYWCELNGMGLHPWFTTPHPKCPVKNKVSQKKTQIVTDEVAVGVTGKNIQKAVEMAKKLH